MITRSLAFLLLVTFVTPLSWANDRPAGVPEEAKWVKVDRVVDIAIVTSLSTIEMAIVTPLLGVFPLRAEP